MDIRNPCVVSLTWRLEDAQGELIDELKEPMEFFFGGDDLLAKVEEALLGQTAGFEAALFLEPEHAFGDYHSELVFFESADIFPDLLEEGMQFDGPPAGAKTPDMPVDVIYTVTEVYDTHVVLDGNHSLAGLALQPAPAQRSPRRPRHARSCGSVRCDRRLQREGDEAAAHAVDRHRHVGCRRQSEDDRKSGLERRPADRAGFHRRYAVCGVAGDRNPRLEVAAESGSRDDPHARPQGGRHRSHQFSAHDADSADGTCGG